MRIGKGPSQWVLIIPGLALGAMTACASGGTAPPSGEGNTKEQVNYPSRAIDWIVPFSAGGGSDRQVRRLQPKMEEALGQQINVVYKTGGSGAVGWQQCHAAEPDGYTICNVVTPDINVLPLDGNVGYKPKGFEYIAWTETSPNGLVVPKDSPYKSLDEFIEAAKSNPNGLTVAGVGKTSRMYWAEMAQEMGIEASYVPEPGGLGDIVPALEGGHVDAAVFGVATLERKEAVRILAVSGTERVKAFPDVPTFASEGYEGISLGTSWGIAAPPGTPKPLIRKLNTATQEAMQTEEVQGKLRSKGLTPLKQTPQEAQQFEKEQHDTISSIWKRVEK